MTRGIDHPMRDTMWEGDWEYILHDLDREAAAMDAAREELLKDQREEDEHDRVLFCGFRV